MPGAVGVLHEVLGTREPTAGAGERPGGGLPDLVGLGDLASACRGAVVALDEEFDWSAWLPEPEPMPMRIAQVPVWHTPWVFALLLVLFAAELLIRRRFRMI